MIILGWNVEVHHELGDGVGDLFIKDVPVTTG